MDPVSIVGLAGSVLGTIDIMTRSIISLRHLQQQWKGADLTVSLLIGQLATLKAALQQISHWISISLAAGPQYHQLVTDLDSALESCALLIVFIDNHLSRLEWNEANKLNFESRARAVLEDKSIKDCVGHLNNQANALNLLLTASNCRSLSEQKTLLETRQSRLILDQVKDASSSLFCLTDSESFCTTRSTTPVPSSRLSMAFDFDFEVLGSEVYQGAMKSLLRQSSRRKVPLKEQLVKSRHNNQQILISWEKPSSTRPNETDMSIKEPRIEEMNETNILVLGLPRSGKSTMLEMMMMVNESSYSREDRIATRRIIFRNIIQAMRLILVSMAFHDDYTQDQACLSHVHTILRQHPKSIDNNLPAEVFHAIKALWKDDRVKRHLKNMHEDDPSRRTAEYYFDSMDRVARSDYVPTNRDIAKCGVADDGLAEIAFEVGGLKYRFLKYDILNIQPKKAYFENVAAIVYVVDFSAYDEPFKNPNDLLSYSNRLSKAFDTYNNIFSENWFPDTPLILALNKIDLFEAKLSISPLKDYFPDYEGGSSITAASDYILDHHNLRARKPVYSRFLSATRDSNTCSIVMTAIYNIVMKPVVKINKTLRTREQGGCSI